MTVEARAQAGARPERRIGRLSLVSWVLYDLANTIFSLNITSLYFSLWVVNAMAGTETLYARASAVATVIVLVAAPVLGALSDQAPRRVPFLIVSTLVCVGCTLLLGAFGLMVSLALFAAASVFYQSGLIFYDALLPEVSTEENRGRVGGLGVGVGYVGALIGIATGLLLLPAEPAAGDYATVFRATAVLFLLFSLPAFLFLRERPRRMPPFGLASVRRAFAEIGETVHRARRYSGLPRFLLGRIFYTDAANTLILFMGVYVTREMGFSAREAQLVLLVSIPAAVAGGLGWGVVVDRIGPKRALDYVLLLWVFVLAWAIAIPVLDLPTALFWLDAALAGFALGSTWTSDRPLMLRLSPPRYLGQFYGLYAMVGRFSAILGPLLWAFIVDTLRLGRPAAIGSLIVLVLVALLVLRGVSDAPRAWSPEDLPAR